MFRLKLEIEGLPKTTNANARRHWRRLQQEAKRWQRNTIIAVGQNKPPEPLAKAILTLTRHSSSEPDFDGLVSSFKHCIDGLKIAGIIVDDKMSVVGQPTYKWEKAPRNHGFITVEIVQG